MKLQSALTLPSPRLGRLPRLRRLVVVVAAWSCAALAPATASASSSDARARTDALIGAFKAVKVPAPTKRLSPADRKANAKAFVALDAFFDFGNLVDYPVAKRLDKFTPEQLAKYKTLFRSVLRLIAYPDSGDFFRTATYTIKSARARGARFEVLLQGELEKEDLQVDVLFVWKKVGGTLRIVDVSFDGASLVRDYRNQFTRIMDKSGVASLLDKLAKRHAKVLKGAASK